ncbi:hypothetical protein FRB95_011938 [Tulasnella sp. JGI-2019a]|nr:hypothetical protein FRB95_011938 [Tulasnella sp. JGI-2019a]
MAEAVFDSSHPLDQYLTESLDDAFYMTMPGNSEDFKANLPAVTAAESAVNTTAWGRMVHYVIQALHTLSSYVPDVDNPTPSTDFAERFKYVIISSSLLEASLTPSSANPTVAKFPSFPLSVSPILPTQPKTRTQQLSRQSGHSRSNSGNQPNIKSLFSSTPTKHPAFEQTLSSWQAIYKAFATPRNTSIAAAILAFVLNGYVLLGVMASLALKTPPSEEADQRLDAQKSSFESTLDGLNLLIGASNAWAYVVHEAISTLEQEERRLFYGPPSPHSPSSSLRVALSSTLQSTQSHTDNIRQLFAPLTSSSQLAQLSEMYAPPPQSAKVSSSSPGGKHPRPQSSPTGISNRMSMSSASVDIKRAKSQKNADKRATWNGVNGSASVKRRHSLQGLKLDAIGSSVEAARNSSPGSSSSTSHSHRFPSSHARNGTSVRSGLASIFDEECEDVPTPDLSADSASAEPSPVATHGFEHATEDSPRVDPSMSLPPTTPSRRPSPVSREDSFTATPPMIRRRRRESSVTPGPPSATPVPSSSDSSRKSFLDSVQSRTLLKSQSENHLSVTPLAPRGGSPSRLNLIQTTRHPLSLSSLHEQLQAALASKRFTAAHLLALRFGDARTATPTPQEQGEAREELELLDGEDESYWEDVRSVMELMTTALEDAAAELGNAVDESFRKKAKDMEVSPLAVRFPTEHNLASAASSPVRLQSPFLDASGAFTPSSGRISQLSSLSVGFAPLPTPLARYAAHIDLLGKALDDARLQLQACASLVEQSQTSPLVGTSYGRASPNRATQRLPIETTLQAWDGLRKDLGVAVRECERGRGSLMDYVKRQAAAQAQPSDDFLDLDGSEEGTNGIPHDQSSNDADADSDDRNHQLLPVHEAIYDSTISEGLGSPVIAGNDEAMQQLLMEAEPKLPHGVEQVFTYDSRLEGESSTAALGREKTKLSRVERIAQMKAKREQALPSPSSSADGPWGPGGEVVQELKSVISRVEEKRKGIANQRLSMLGELITMPERGEPVVVAAAATSSHDTLRVLTSASRASSPLSAECDLDHAASPAAGIGVAL